MEVTQAKVNEIWHKLMKAKNLSQDAISKRTDGHHNNLFALLKEIDDSCNNLVNLLQPKRLKHNELQEA